MIPILSPGAKGFRVPAGSSSPIIPIEELAGAAGFCVLPVLLMAGTALTTGYFMDRYAVTDVIGCAILVPGLCLALSLFVLFIGITATQRRPVLPLAANQAWLPNHDRLPIAVSNPLVFLQGVRYATPELRGRLCYLGNRQAAARQPDSLPELVLPTARRWADFNLEPYQPVDKVAETS
jgi:hypothetical protein